MVCNLCAIFVQSLCNLGIKSAYIAQKTESLAVFCGQHHQKGNVDKCSPQLD